MHLVIFLIIFSTGDLEYSEYKIVTDLDKVLQFAENLEKEGDYYRAITEYKRFLYLSNDTLLTDSILYIITHLNEKMNRLEDALNTINDIKQKNTEKFKFEVGRIYLLMKKYEQARHFWSNDTILLGWTYLREGKFKKAREYLKFCDSISFKKPMFAALLSGFVPGAGRVYAGRIGDAIFSFLLTMGSAYSAYHYYQKKAKIPAVIFGSLAIYFYLGDIYGAALSVKIHNKKKSVEFIHNIETKFGFIKCLP